jgi:hypothetical protein
LNRRGNGASLVKDGGVEEEREDLEVIDLPLQTASREFASARAA